MNHQQIDALLSFSNATNAIHAAMPLPALQHITDHVEGHEYMVIISDLSDVMPLFLNRKAREFLQLTNEAAQALGKGFYGQLLHPDNLDSMTAVLRHFLHTPTQPYYVCYKVITPQHPLRCIQVVTRQLPASPGSHRQLVISACMAVDNLVNNNSGYHFFRKMIDELAPLMPLFTTLTPAEKEMLQLMIAGHSDRDIATNTHHSFHTIKTHRKNIMAKLKVNKAICLGKYHLLFQLDGLEGMGRVEKNKM